MKMFQSFLPHSPIVEGDIPTPLLDIKIITVHLDVTSVKKMVSLSVTCHEMDIYDLIDETRWIKKNSIIEALNKG